MYKLYILMRDDLESLNPGKAMAQAAHAANMAQTLAKLLMPEKWAQWSGDRCFGTTIVLASDIERIESLEIFHNNNYMLYTNEQKLIAGSIKDPTYPLRDGSFIHYIPVTTCGFIFGNVEDEEIEKYIGDLNLYD